MTWRYEVKCLVPESAFAELEVWVAGGRFVSRKFPRRQVNSVYFDTPDMQCALDNLEGMAARQKYRVRWYGEAQDLSAACFEIKERNGRLGRKRNFALTGLEDLEQICGSVDRWLPRFGDERLTHLLSLSAPLLPVLTVSYDRDYFEGPGGIRMTIDKGLRFRDLRLSATNETALGDREIAIVEFKFTPEIRGEAARYIQTSPFQPLRNSKYLLALSALGHAVYL